MGQRKGAFIISLDFEMRWGFTDSEAENYKENLSHVRSVVPCLLELFKEYEIHTTWATVGLLFFQTRDELLKGLPTKKPSYVNSELSPYTGINSIGRNESEDPLRYAASLIKMIASLPHQEIACHTFSHYFCLEKGQDAETFKEDLAAAIKVAKRFDISLESFVFPKNQINSKYLPICRELGIKAYRGYPSAWIYSRKKNENAVRRALRLMDSYVNLSGHNCYSEDGIQHEVPINIPASRFLRPYSERLKILEPLRLRRILCELTYAAKKGLIYHLWWHPCNFGANLEENISVLNRILKHFRKLANMYGMESLNMAELSSRLIGDANCSGAKDR